MGVTVHTPLYYNPRRKINPQTNDGVKYFTKKTLDTYYSLNEINKYYLKIEKNKINVNYHHVSLAGPEYLLPTDMQGIQLQLCDMPFRMGKNVKNPITSQKIANLKLLKV